MNFRRFALLVVCACPLAAGSAAAKIPPYDLWTEEILEIIRDRATLEIEINPGPGYLDVFFTSNHRASWFDAAPPYDEHRDEKIRIHAFLASPAAAGTYPALVIGHGHQGKADRNLAITVASLGYVALAIDGPRAGQSVGGPEDDNQAWISVDKGPEYGYLFHYAYAAMRAMTLLEELADLPGNPYRIDDTRLGVLGASMGGVMATYVNGIDHRVQAAVTIASAGSWHHTLRYQNSWLYHGVYTGTRDLPYNGQDPENSIENIDTDPTAVTFMNYFDPIRYALRQHAPILSIIGTHDEYFPLPSANLMQLAISSAGTRADFEKRLWLVPNAPHALDSGVNLLQLLAGIRQWLDYCFGAREAPLAQPRVTLSSRGADLSFEIDLDESPDRLAAAQVALYVGTRVDSRTGLMEDFKEYSAAPADGRFSVLIPAGGQSTAGEAFTSENVLYYATAKGPFGMPVSSLLYKAGIVMDLSTDFSPGIRHYPDGTGTVPLPPAHMDTATSLVTTSVLTGDTSYEGVAVSNPTSDSAVARLEVRDSGGRIKAAEGLVNPGFINLSPGAQRVFLLHEWMGPGVRQIEGTVQVAWTDVVGSALGFRGDAQPSSLHDTGPLQTATAPLWLPLGDARGGPLTRRVVVMSDGENPEDDVRILLRNSLGSTLETRSFGLSGGGTANIVVPEGSGAYAPAYALIQSENPIAATVEAAGDGDAWSIDALPAPTATRYVLPYLEWNGRYTTTLQMINPSVEGRTAAIEIRTPEGFPAFSKESLYIPGNQWVSMRLEEIFRIDPEGGSGAGWLEVNSPGGSLVIVASAEDVWTGAIATANLDSSSSSMWSLPFFIEGDGYYTGLALANPGGEGASITITAFDDYGTIVARAAHWLEARQCRYGLISEWMTGLSHSGHLLVTTSAPSAILSYFGADDGTSLSIITPIPIAKD